ncbi:hypothetical protein ACVIWU_004983 [Bradyrhizobium sp. USDA 4509]
MATMLCDADSRDNLGTRAVNGLDQPPTEFSGVFKIERNQPGRGMGLIKGINRFNEDHLPSDKRTSWLMDFSAGNKNERSSGATLTSCFGLKSTTNLGAGVIGIGKPLSNGLNQNEKILNKSKGSRKSSAFAHVACERRKPLLASGQRLRVVGSVNGYTVCQSVGRPRRRVRTFMMSHGRRSRHCSVNRIQKLHSQLLDEERSRQSAAPADAGKPPLPVV